jgi:hypothetical protein
VRCPPKRWPDRACLETLDDKIQAGYALDSENNTHAATVTWLNAWSDVLRLCDATGISSIEEFDDRFPMTQSLFNWSQDLEMALENAGRDDGEMRQALIEFCEESLRRFPREDQSLTENRRRALGGAYFDAGMIEKAEELFRSWLDADPGWGWGWIGWADCYLPWGGRPTDLARAENYCAAATASPVSGTGFTSRSGCKRYARTAVGPAKPGSSASRQDIPVNLLVAVADHRRSQAEQLRLVADDVQMHPVLHRLRLRNRVDPDQRPLACRILDRDRPVQRTGAFAHLAHVTESRAPPVGQSLMVAGVEAEILETCWHPLSWPRFRVIGRLRAHTGNRTGVRPTGLVTR